MNKMQKPTNLKAGATTAPTALATPTDLTPDEVRAVADAVNPLIADSFALYLKTKNFHWHLSGRRFRDLHLLFDKQATDIFAAIDPLAERLRKIGATTMRSIAHVSEKQTIADDNEEFVTPDDMVARLLADNRHIAKAMRDAIKVAEDSRDSPTENLLEELLDKTERRTWFLFEITQDGNRA